MKQLIFSIWILQQDVHVDSVSAGTASDIKTVFQNRPCVGKYRQNNKNNGLPDFVLASTVKTIQAFLGKDSNPTSKLDLS